MAVYVVCSYSKIHYVYIGAVWFHIPKFAHLLYVHQYNVLHNSNKKQFCCIYVAHWYVLAIGCNHVHIFPHLAFTGTISLMPALSPLPKLSTQQSLSQNYGKPCFDP